MTTSSTRRIVPFIAVLLISGAAVGLGAGVAQATDSSTTTSTIPVGAADTSPTTAPVESTIGPTTTTPVLATIVSDPLAGECRQEHYEWTGPVLLASFAPRHDTGIVIPAPLEGGSLRVIEANYVASNAYPEQLPDHTRARDAQMHESFALFVGDTQVGGLTPDLPDTVEQGATNDWNSGEQVGAFGAASVLGGRVVLEHSFLFGYDESANSIETYLLSIDVERCGAPIATTTVPAEICTCPPTTEATTTTVEVTPVTEASAHTTSPGSGDTTVPTTTPVATTPRATTTTEPILVATGATSGWIVGAGGASLLSGLTLLRLRRRGRPL